MSTFLTTYKSFFYTCCLLFLASPSALAQVIPETDTTNRKEVMIRFSELMEFVQEEDRSIRKLSGSVTLQQDSILLYCDTAFLEGNQVIAYGNVIIKQGDSLNVFSDSLVYRGEERIADLFGEVVLEDGEKKLFTTYLNYDLGSKTGRYTQGGLVSQKNTQLVSKRGVYSVRTKQLFFKDSVVVVNDKVTLRADTLEFDSDAQIATFLGPTLIQQDSATIYCEEGFYDMDTELAEFSKNAQYQKGRQRATADLITYDGSIKQILLEGNAQVLEDSTIATANQIRYEEDTDITYLEGDAYYKDNQQEITSQSIKYDSDTEAFSTAGRSLVEDENQLLEADQLDFDSESGIGVAKGNVFWQDTIENLSIKSEQLDYDKASDYVKAYGARPLLATLLDKDTLYLASDTLISQQTEDSLSQQQLNAFEDVRIFSNELQATCDSLSYIASDSIFKLYRNPVIWSDTSQFTADSVFIQLANNKIDRILLYQNGLIINTPDFQFFNQIQGKLITAFFESGNLRRMKVEGNAESIYFARDAKDAYLGMNRTTCSEMLILFGANEVDQIKFFTQPAAKMHAMKEVQASPPTLDGFDWQFPNRPLSIASLRKLKPMSAKIKKKEPSTEGAEEEEEGTEESKEGTKEKKGGTKEKIERTEEKQVKAIKSKG